jgi:hypothetical protein
VEETRQHSVVSKLAYRDSTVLVWASVFLAVICYIWFGPEASGRYALRESGNLNWRGWAVFGCGLAVFLLSLPHVFHVLIRRPALEVGKGELRIWMLPYDTIPLGEISKIEVGDDRVDIYRKDKRRRKINVRILDQPRAFFFDEVRSRIVNKDIVQEK